MSPRFLRPAPLRRLLVASIFGALSAFATPALWAQDAARQELETTRGLDHSHFTEKEWEESQAPPPPDFDLRRLVELEMPHYMSLRFGVDPKTMSVTGDGIVRYVVIAHRPGAQGTVNAFYEGVRCATGEYKTYARYSGSEWNNVTNAEWKRIDDRNSVYTYQLAKQSLCMGRAPRVTVDDMIRELKQPETLR